MSSPLRLTAGHIVITLPSLTYLQGWGAVWGWPLVGSLVTPLCSRLLVGDAVNKPREGSSQCWHCGLYRAGEAGNWKDGGVEPSVPN